MGKGKTNLIIIFKVTMVLEIFLKAYIILEEKYSSDAIDFPSLEYAD